jgi:hypothetical protein
VSRIDGESKAVQKNNAAAAMRIDRTSRFDSIKLSRPHQSAGRHLRDLILHSSWQSRLIHPTMQRCGWRVQPRFVIGPGGHPSE